MNMTHKLLATGALALFACTAAKANSPEYVWYWSGKAGDGMWNNTTNWIKAAGSWTPRPDYHDTVVFTNDAPFLLDFGKFGENSYLNVRKFKFKGSAPVYTKSGLVFSGGANLTQPAERPELFVDAGAEVVCSNGVQMYNGGSLWKTGAGTVRIISKQSRTSQSPGGPCFTISEGAWIAQLEPGESYGCYNQNTNMIVEAGAAFEIHGYNSMGGAGIWRLDGTLRLNCCGGETQIGTLTGTGRVERVAGVTASTTLKLHPGTVGPQTFSGTFGPNVNVTIVRDAGRSDEEFVATLSNADTMKDTPLSGNLNALRFAPNVGDFNFKTLTFTSAANLNLADTDGEPVNVHVTDVGTPANMSLGGCGDFCVASDLTLAGNVVTNTGRLVMENAKKLIAGNGTAAKDVDLSTLKGIAMTGGDLEIKNTVPTAIASLTGKGGKFSASAAVSFGEYAYQGRYGASSAVTIRDGGVTNLTFYPGTGSLTVSGGVYHATAEVCSWGYANTKVPKPANVMQGNTALTLEGGEIWLRNYSSNSGYGHLRSVLVNPGAAFCCNQFKWRSAATAENPDRVTLDGGSFVIPTADHQYNIELPASGADGKVRFLVGANGGRVVSHGVRGIQAPEIDWRAPFESAPGVTDGGIAFFPRMSDMKFFNPVLLTGGMSFTEGRLIFGGYGQLETTPEFFGTGDFTLTDTVLYLDPKSSGEKTLQIAKNATFIYAGNVSVALRTSTSTVGSPVPQHIEVGSLAARGPGSALIIYEASDKLGAGASSFKVLNGVATNAAGLVKQPVALDLNSVQCLAAYDDEQGLVKFANGKSAAAAKDGDVIDMTGSETLAANTVKNVLAVNVPNWGTLTIPETSKVNVGDGTNPALVLINNGGLAGAGAVDFGTSEGVIVVGHHPYGAKANCVLDGKNGITYIARAAFGGRFVTVAKANVYEGPTRITTVCVRPTDARSFSTGEVRVCGGERNGGKIQFTVPLTFENDFRVSGWGHQMNEWTASTGGYGALTFQTNDVVLAGKVAIEGQMRMSAEKAGNLGILEGQVSGGTLTVYGGKGAVRLTGDNVHTGGTEVVNATLELAKGTGAGTGAVLLDAGVLKFVNTEPITFANEVTGVGTVVFAGTAPVTLTGASFANLPFRTFAAGTSIDVANAANNVYAPYFTGDTDLRGLELTVGGIAGVGTVSNGRLTVTGEIQPGGPNALGTLTFAEGVFAAGTGAHYVCDIVGDATDKLEIAGDVDLSAISFTAVANGRVESGKSSVLTCTGARSGAFNAVTLPKKWMGVEYGAREAILDHMRPGALILVR